MNGTRIDDAVRRRQWRHNQLATVATVAGIVALLVVTAFLFAGPGGIVWAAVGGALSVLLAGTVTPAMVARVNRAGPVPRHAAPELHDTVERLAARAGLERPPALYYAPSRMPNAFAVGSREDSLVCVTDGILRTLSPRELAGVLAHEIAHIQAGDLGVLRLADVVRRILSALALLGILIVLFHLPGAVALSSGPAAFGLFLVMVAPTAGVLLQLALSRTREHQADLVAVALTDDPDGLASALRKLEEAQRRFFLARAPGSARPLEAPAFLRSHPLTEERLERLDALKRAGSGAAWGPWGPFVAPPPPPAGRSFVPRVGRRA